MSTVQTPFASDPAQEVYFESGPYQLFGKLRIVSREAPTLLLLHGLGFHSFEYDPLASLLAQGAINSFAFDYRCHGRSSGPRGRWVLHELVDDADKATEFLCGKVEGDIGVFGNSLGAIAGLYLAARNPLVKSLVASGCPTRVADFAITPTKKALLGFLQTLAIVVPLRISVNHFIPYKKILQDPRIIQLVRRDKRISDARRFAPATYADMFRWNALDVIDQVKVPLLILYGIRDRLQPAEQSAMLFESARPPKEMHALDTGHVPNLENPDLINPILRGWFGKTLSPGCRDGAPPEAVQQAVRDLP